MGCLNELQCAAYADGELPAHETERLEDHLRTCAACRSLVAALRIENRVLIECLQSCDLIEFELEDEALAAPQAQQLGVMRLAAFVLAMSVLLRPALNLLEQIGIPDFFGWLAWTGTYVVPAAAGFTDSVVMNASWIALCAILVLAFVLFSRRSPVASSTLSLLALLTFVSSPSYGFDIRRGGGPVMVPSGETVDDTLVVAGERVAIDGTVTGDVIAFVREVSVRGTVKGNVIAFARTVDVEGMVEGSVIGFAQSVRMRAQVAHNVYGLGQNVEIGRDARIEGNAMILAADSDIEGSIGKDAYARAGSVNIGPAAHIGRNFSARTGRRDNVRIAPEASIGGVTDIRIPQPAPSRYSTLSFYVWQTIWLAAAFLTGLLLFWIFPSLAYAGFETTRALLVAAGAGFIALVAPPVAAVIGAITLIGLPLGLMALACWVVAIYISKIVVAGFVGRSLLARGGDTQPATALMLLAGLVPIRIAINLPYLGPLVNLLLVILGLGLIVVHIGGGPRRHPAQAQAA